MQFKMHQKPVIYLQRAVMFLSLEAVLSECRSKSFISSFPLALACPLSFVLNIFTNSPPNSWTLISISLLDDFNLLC